MPRLRDLAWFASGLLIGLVIPVIVESQVMGASIPLFGLLLGRY